MTEPDSHPEDVRHYLEVSTRNLPEAMAANIVHCPGLLAWPHDLGCYIYVPADEGEFQDMAREGTPPEVLGIVRRAMSLGCSLIDLRRDVDPVGQLPTYESQPAPPAAAPSWPAGWYPDPTRQARLRWWDGQQWTGHVSH